MFFNKPKVKYNIVNDLDSDVFNLFKVVMNQKKELEEAFNIMPIHQDLLNYWKENKESESIKKAIRFIFLSNLTYMGAGMSLRGNPDNPKKTFSEKLNLTHDIIKDVQFFNKNCVDFINSISLTSIEKARTFIYCDPPYLETGSNYSENFTKEDSEKLFNCLEKTNCKFAVSEFNHPFIIKQAKQRKLNIIIIGERNNLKNVRTEIIVTNYKNRQPELF